MAKESLNNGAWEKIFDKHKILDSVAGTGHALIHANDIKVFREPRLMTKFDHLSQLPKLFKDNSLTILPVSRGGYIIGNFQTYHQFEASDDDVIRVTAPTFLESLDFSSVSSEATAINCAFVSKILNDFTQEDELYPTVNGRMKSSHFNFEIKIPTGSFNIDVKNSQVEIDGGFEGLNSLTLLEAKNYISDDFLVRQLYYPYQLWANKIHKPVRPIFLTYTNGIFHLREYEFQNIHQYNSIRLVRQQKYSIQHVIINVQTVQDILVATPTVAEPKVPFPQADSFKRVINLGELLMERGIMPKEDITTNYGFTDRQTDYYSNALMYLGLIATSKVNGVVVVSLTDKGKALYSKDIDSRQLEFISLIVSQKAFKKTIEAYFNTGVMPSDDEIVDIMKGSNLYNIGKDSTYHRRASTIAGWVNWIISTIEE